MRLAAIAKNSQHFNLSFTMKKLLFWAIMGIAVLAVSCKRDAGSEQTSRKVSVNTVQLEKTSGKDCDQPDSLRIACLAIRLSRPVVTEGSDALKNAVESWGTAYLAGILSPELSAQEASAADVEATVQTFIDGHNQFLAENEGALMGYWTAESDATTVLNDGKHLTLQINGFVFSGGAHGSPTAAVATFDAATGQQLGWNDLVTDQAAVQALAEKKFRVEQAEAFNDGFAFDDTFPFALPANFGLTDKGIYFYYVAYEVAPYAMGATAFEIPFSELGDLYKLKK